MRFKDLSERAAGFGFVFLAVAGSLVFWVVEAAMHSFVFSEGAFFEELFTTDMNEVWMRLLLAGLLVTFGWYADSVIAARIRTGEALKVLKERYETLAESANDSIFIINRDLTIRYVNTFGAKSFSLTPDEMKGRRLSEFFPAGSMNHQEINLRYVMEHASAVFAENKFVMDGREVWLETSLVPLAGSDGAVDAVMGISRDITVRKLMEATLRDERDMAQKYLELSGVIFLVLDKNRRVKLINRKGCELLGCLESEVIGLNWFEHFLPEEDKEGCAAVFDKLVSGESEDIDYYENRVVCTDGRVRTVAWHNTPIRDNSGAVVGTLSSGEDITERRRMEDSMRDRIDELERFRKATVARELRLKELKDRIAKLEARESARKVSA